jgi:hypothetical protein
MELPIPDAVRRFILTSIPTVPHIETLLLAWREPDAKWTAADIARRLFIVPEQARGIADELCEADLLQCGGGEPRVYSCRREPQSLALLLAELDTAYTRHLRQVTALIHSNVDRKAQRFAQAFTWEKKP